jgi:hypothetical protein
LGKRKRNHPVVADGRANENKIILLLPTAGQMKIKSSCRWQRQGKRKRNHPAVGNNRANENKIILPLLTAGQTKEIILKCY